MEVITKSAQETKRLGKRFGSGLTGGEVVALTGDLGSGKTTFVQGMARGLGIDKRIISPTFILMRQYGDFYHLDLYRLEKDVHQEVRNLGVDDIWGKGEGIMVIEWAEKIKDILPEDSIWVEFKSLGKDKRKIVIKK